MQATTEELQALVQVQDIDLELRRIAKQLEDLPQRAAILEARKKRAAIQTKQEQVSALQKEAAQKLSRAADEDARLAEKQRAVQEAIDAAGGDYRNLESRTKELNGFAKRRAALEVELDTLGAEAAKIDGVAKQIETALAAIERVEREAIASFQQEGGALKSEEARLSTERARIAEQLSPELLALYKKTAARAGGVAVALFSQAKCGACRMPMEAGHLSEIKKNAPLATCPHCKRLLIIV